MQPAIGKDFAFNLELFFFPSEPPLSKSSSKLPPFFPSSPQTNPPRASSQASRKPSPLPLLDPFFDGIYDQVLPEMRELSWLKFSSSQMSSKSYLGFREPLVFIFLVLFSVEDRHASASQMDDCWAQRCGNVSITFPFWVYQKQPSFCGYPPFNITCSIGEDNKTETPILTILGYQLVVKNISYDNRSIHLASRLYEERCNLPYINISSELYPFSPSSSNKQIYFLYNCTGSEDSHFYRYISCPLFGPVYFGGEYNQVAKLKDQTCRIVMAPVMAYNELSLDGNYTDWLMSGWLFDWTAPDCTECRGSGGQCGYDNSTSTFMCMCRDRNHTHKCNQKKPIRRIIIAVAAAFGGVIALACAVIFIFYRNKKRQRTRTSKYISRNFSKKNREMAAHLQIHLFSYNELMEATDDFDASRELGDGGYGTVYKGKLHDGRTVAVKRLYDRNCRQIEQFMNEVEILSRLRHQNLVSLYGCTSYHSRELLLVYEYISNGTVADHLHGSRASEKILTWPMRLNIAIETADALAYLHAVDPPIIHRDVKTNNILLDSSFHVKVADFGLSRLFPHDATHVSTAPQGTPGYVDPEYHQCFQLTDKSDVYSFGVVLVELISSKPAIDIGRQRSEINLANMAMTKIQNHELDDLMDSDLWYPDEARKMMITMVAELAFRCLQSDGDMRPPIKEVLDGLQAIERSMNKVDKQEKDDVGLIQNIALFSPDTVAGKWVSKTTTPSTSH